MESTGGAGFGLSWLRHWPAVTIVAGCRFHTNHGPLCGMGICQGVPGDH